jgi:hypothetical protein
MGAYQVPALHTPEDPLSQYAKAMSIRGAMQQQQMGEQDIQKNDIAIQQQQQAVKDQQTVRATLAKYQGDMDKALPELAGQVTPQTYQSLVKMHVDTLKEKTELDTKQLDLKMKHNDQFLGLIDQAKSLPPDQYASQYPMIAQQALSIRPDLKGKIDPSQPIPQEALDALSIGLMTDQNYNAKVKMKQEAQAAADAHAKAQADLPGAQAKSDEAVRSNYASQLAGAKDQADYDQRRGQLPFAIAKQFPDQFDKDAVLQAGMTPHEQASIPMDKLEYKDWYQQQKAKGLPASHADFLLWKNKNSPTMMMSSNLNLTPEATAMAAQLYAQTGQLPGGLSRAPQVTASVINSAAKTQDGSTPDIAANKANYKADSESLKKIQTNFDQVTAFENTAGKNLDVFLKTAKPIIDSGSPLLNTPVRAISDRMAGSDKMAAFNAARTTALTEIAKVLNSSNASGVSVGFGAA